MLIESEEGGWYTEDHLWFWSEECKALYHRVCVCEPFTKDWYYNSKAEAEDHIHKQQQLTLSEQGWGVDGVVECDCGKVFLEYEK